MISNSLVITAGQAQAKQDFCDFWYKHGQRIVLDILKEEAVRLGWRGIPSNLGNDNGSLFLRNGDGNKLSFELDHPSCSILSKMTNNGKSSEPTFFDDATVFIVEAIIERAKLYAGEVVASHSGSGSAPSGESAA